MDHSECGEGNGMQWLRGGGVRSHKASQVRVNSLDFIVITIEDIGGPKGGHIVKNQWKESKNSETSGRRDNDLKSEGAQWSRSRTN